MANRQQSSLWDLLVSDCIHLGQTLRAIGQSREFKYNRRSLIFPVFHTLLNGCFHTGDRLVGMYGNTLLISHNILFILLAQPRLCWQLLLLLINEFATSWRRSLIFYSLSAPFAIFHILFLSPSYFFFSGCGLFLSFCLLEHAKMVDILIGIPFTIPRVHVREDKRYTCI